ncbi:PA4642 family protein [Halieaceae bacterium]|jgi:hypothetical protein|nr:PA4642 family protein [Halieaceae bacterium]
MKKDKEKVIDEVWTQDRVKSFLEVKSYDNSNEDFHMLFKAYQSMRADNFTEFVEFFSLEKRDINAKNDAGQSVLDIVKEHRNSEQYATILTKAGAL